MLFFRKNALRDANPQGILPVCAAGVGCIATHGNLSIMLRLKSDLLPDPGLILIDSHIINNKVGGLNRIKGQRVSGIMIRVLYEESDRVRLHFFSACGGRGKEIKVFDSVRTVSCTIHLAVPGECCGLTLILAFSDRCGNCELTVSATGSVSSQFLRHVRT